MHLQLTKNVRVNAGEELGRAPIAKRGGADEFIAPIDLGHERASRVALTSVDAAVGVDAGAEHGGRDPVEVRLPRVAVRSLDHLHRRLRSFQGTIFIRASTITEKSLSAVNSLTCEP